MARRLSQLAALDVTELRGIGPSHAAALAKAFEIHTVLDLLQHYPRRYVDRSNHVRIDALQAGDEAMVLATVKRISARRTRGRPPKVMVTADVTDGSGYLKVTFFNQGWRERQLPEGTECVLFGKVDTYQGRLQLTNPVVDLVGDRTGRIIAMYPQSERERITTWDLARWLTEVLERSGTFADPVPAALLTAHGLVDRTTALHGIHFPEQLADAQAARTRLVFDELLRVQLALVRRKLALERSAVGISQVADAEPGSLLDRFAASLPFTLTAAQQRVIAELEADLASPRPMHRLLQGDVGAGKTLVAVHALLIAVQNGHQGAFMAPTEVLAEQHHAAVSALVDGLTVGDGDTSLFGERPVRASLLTNRVGAAERRRVLAGLADGTVDLVVGTHALIQEGVDFSDLSVAVIDEQHRFGVEQRAALPRPRRRAVDARRAGHDGDTDPQDRGDDRLRRPRRLGARRAPAGTHTDRHELGARRRGGRRVDAGARGGGRGTPGLRGVPPHRGVREARGGLRRGDPASDWAHPAASSEDLRVGVLHGRLPGPEKQSVMEQFRAGALDVLVATTVIEVGVDVPNASVMVILDAERFGIAQLHQLRGRVGRGAARSWCVLVADPATPDGEARLEALVASNDGFALAEVDLDLRGEGTLMSSRQTGRNDLRLASLRRDRAWVGRAREAALSMLDEDPNLEDHPGLAEELELLLGDDATDFLFKS